MKPDLFFLILVLAAGGLGLYLNTKNSYKYLEDLKPKKTTSAQTKKSDRAATGPGGVAATAMKPNELYLASGNDIAYDALTVADIQDQWMPLFTQWKGVLEVNITDRSRLNSLTSIQPCLIEITYLDQRSQQIPLSQSQVKRDGSTLIFYKSEEEILSEITNLLKPVSVLLETETLFEFCAVASTIIE